MLIIKWINVSLNKVIIVNFILLFYDGKCLNYSDDGLFMQECKKNNKYEDFIINNGNICSRIDKNYCLNGKFRPLPSILESKKNMKI